MTSPTNGPQLYIEDGYFSGKPELKAYIAPPCG